MKRFLTKIEIVSIIATLVIVSFSFSAQGAEKEPDPSLLSFVDMHTYALVLSDLGRSYW